MLVDIHKDMMSEKEKKGKKRKRQESDNQEYFDSEEEIGHESIAVNEYVAVAYQDMWYPGVVDRITEDCLIVNFMTETRNPGFYTWPTRKDVQRVRKEFVIKRGFVPHCRNSGRLWFIDDFKQISTTFERYRKMYF